MPRTVNAHHRHPYVVVVDDLKHHHPAARRVIATNQKQIATAYISLAQRFPTNYILL
jgi:hypothetical protein